MSLRRIYLVTVLILVGCGSRDTTQPVPTTTSLKPLALGDSYTIGQSVVQSESWPFQLAAALRTDSLSIVQPPVVAATGWTTSDLLQAIAEASLDPS